MENNLDFGTAYNMPDTGGGSGFFSNLMSALSGKGDVMSIIADQAGQKLSPGGSNIFGGLGTSLAQSKMAGAKMEKDKAASEDLLSKLIKDLGSSSDMNKMTAVRDANTGEIKIDTQTKVPRKIDDTLPQAEKTVSAGSVPESQKSVGSMQDMMKTYR